MQTEVPLCQFGAGSGHGAPLAAIGLRTDIVHFSASSFVVVGVNFILHQEDENEHKDGCHDDASNNNDHCSTQELGVGGSALSVFLLCGELHTSDHGGCRQGRHTILVNSQDAQVVLTPGNQVSQEEGLAGSWNHPAMEANPVNARSTRAPAPEPRKGEGHKQARQQPPQAGEQSLAEDSGGGSTATEEGTNAKTGHSASGSPQESHLLLKASKCLACGPRFIH